MIKAYLIVKHINGIHARPSSLIARKLEAFESLVTFTCESTTVDARSILSLLSLSADHNAEIEVVIKGRDENQVLEMLTTIFENEFIEAF
jgi:phosphotransferase system HPr (HPr) family protein